MQLFTEKKFVNLHLEELVHHTSLRSWVSGVKFEEFLDLIIWVDGVKILGKT